MENFPYKLKLARRAAGLTQQAVADALGMTKQAYGKYERGATKPNSTRLLAFSRILGRPLDFFATPARLDLAGVKWRRRSGLPAKTLHGIQADIAVAVENVLLLEERLGIKRTYDAPDLKQKAPLTAVSAKIDRLADRLRAEWKVGADAIPNLRGLLELRGIRVVEVDLDTSFDGLSSMVDETIPVIVMNVRESLPDVRRRFTLAHELAHLLLDIDEDNIQKRVVERICDRFAGALLLPERTIKAVLGDYRSNFSLYELNVLRQQFGVSVAAIVYRAAALGIFPESLAKSFWMARNEDRDLKEEKDFAPYPSESSGGDYLRILLARAVAEEAITVSRAAAIGNISLEEARGLGQRPEGLSPRAYA